LPPFEKPGIVYTDENCIRNKKSNAQLVMEIL
jgi:hypothetical protein